MPTGALTSQLDIAAIVFTAFWIFFIGLIIYLHRENKREGYPLDSDRTDRSGGRVKVQGFPAVPQPKSFTMRDGSKVYAPREEPASGPIPAEPIASFPGAPLEPTGNPLVDAIGPASYCDRIDHPEKTLDGENQIVPLRVAEGWDIEPDDPDPRGMPVEAADGETVGTIRDAWIDRGEPQIRYYEIALAGKGDVPGANVIVPVNFTTVDGFNRKVKISAINSSQFADVPLLRNPDEITLREEDRISAYYAGGVLYGMPGRTEPVL